MEQGIKIGEHTVSKDGPFFFISGPCVIENEATTLEVARFLKNLGEELEIPVVFKTSYDKANRTSLNSFRGPGLDRGMEIIKKVKDTLGLPVLSDVHSADQVEKVKRVLDIIQIPAFLCRQTDLLLEAAGSGLPVNVKKGQFISPLEMGQAVDKIVSSGNRSILITERGTTFGYNNLVVDFRSIPIMKDFGFPIVFDATHSVQLPGGSGTASGGQREFVGTLSRAAVAAGADGVFMEIHPDPNSALCDGANSLPLGEVKPLLVMLKRIHSLLKS
ncbi:3-deoxy-8-phosphooctulonate synthase [Thermodesulfobacteriota bacterium]